MGFIIFTEFSSHPSFPLNPPIPAATNLFSVSINVPILDISYKRES